MSALSKQWFMMCLPLWLYIVLFKAGGTVYFSALSPLGERVLPLWVVGLLVGGSSLVQLLLDVPAGYLLDRFGYVRLLRLASLVLGFGGIFFLLFGLSIWSFIVLILISGCGWLFFGPGVDAYVLTAAPRSHVGRWMGVQRSMNSLGVVIGASLFSLLLPFPTAGLALGIAVLLFLASLSALFLKKEQTSVHTEQKIETHYYYVRRTFLKETLLAFKKLRPASGMLAFSGFTTALFYSIIWFVLPLYIHSLQQAGPMQFALGIFDATVIVCGGLIGKLADTKNKRLYIFLGLLVFAMFGTLSGIHLNGWFLVFGFIAAVGDELSSVSLWAWMNQLNRDHAHDGLIASVINFSQDLGWVVGPVLAGLVYASLGPSLTILVGCGFVFLSWAVSAILLHRNVSLFFHSPFPSSKKPHRYAHKN
jgi:DHA1 family multidrug resistance protein-like MFS transporter